MQAKLDALLLYIAARLAEPGTWQGIGIIAGLFGGKYADMDWQKCTALGIGIYGLLKMLLPDSQPKDKP